MVNQIAWKDNSLVLCQSSVYYGHKTRELLRKRPKESSTSAKTARAVFGGEFEKILEIPEFIDDYNHHAKAVDRGDQLKYYTPGLRPIRRGGWQSIFHWLLNTVLVNSYLLSFHSKVPKSEKFTCQYDFRKALQRALFDTGERVLGKRKRTETHTDIKEFIIPVHQHQWEHRGRRGDCVFCKGERHGDPPRKRIPLQQIASNLGRNSCRRTSVFGCKECQVPLCRKGSCFDSYHSKC